MITPTRRDQPTRRWPANHPVSRMLEVGSETDLIPLEPFVEPPADIRGGSDTLTAALRRSMSAVSMQSMRLLRTLGVPVAGPVRPAMAGRSTSMLVDEDPSSAHPISLRASRLVHDLRAMFVEMDLEVTVALQRDTTGAFTIDLTPDSPCPSSTEYALLNRTLARAALVHGLGVEALDDSRERWCLVSAVGTNLLSSRSERSAATARLLFLSAMIIAHDRHADLLEAPGVLHRLDSLGAGPRREGLAIDGPTLAALHDEPDAPSFPSHAGTVFDGAWFLLPSIDCAEASVLRAVIVNTTFADGLERINRRLERMVNHGDDADTVHDTARLVIDQILREHGWALAPDPAQMNDGTNDVVARSLSAMRRSETVAMFTRHDVMSERDLLRLLTMMVERYIAEARAQAGAIVYSARWIVMPHAVEHLSRLTAREGRSEGVSRLDELVDELAEAAHAVAHTSVGIGGAPVDQAMSIAVKLHPAMAHLEAVQTRLKAILAGGTRA